MDVPPQFAGLPQACLRTHSHPECGTWRWLETENDWLDDEMQSMLFVYWLCWVFVAMHCLSNCAEWGLIVLSWGAWLLIAVAPLMLGKIEGRRRRGWHRVRWLEGITDSMDMSLSKLWDMVKDREAWHAAVHGATKSRTQLSKWTTTLVPENRL